MDSLVAAANAHALPDPANDGAAPAGPADGGRIPAAADPAPVPAVRGECVCLCLCVVIVSRTTHTHTHTPLTHTHTHTPHTHTHTDPLVAVVWRKDTPGTFLLLDDTPSPIDRIAATRMTAFFEWSLQWRAWGSFKGETLMHTTETLGFYGDRYIGALPKYLKTMVDARQRQLDAGNGEPAVRWTSLVTHWNALTRWSRHAIKIVGQQSAPPLMKWAVELMESMWAQKRANQGNQDAEYTVTWPAVDYFTEPTAAAPSPSLVRPMRGRPRAFVPSEDHTHDKTLFPGDDPLPRSAISPDAPWWIHLMFMPVKMKFHTTEDAYEYDVIYAPRLEELRDLSFFDNGDNNWVDLDYHCLHIRKFKNSAHRSSRIISLTPDWVERFSHLRVHPSEMPAVPQKPNQLLETWLRPACVLYYGERDPELAANIRLTVNSIRSLAFNDLMHQVQERPLKSYQWLLLDKELRDIHDHSLRTALTSYTKMVPAEVTKRLQSVWKETWKEVPQTADVSEGAASYESVAEILALRDWGEELFATAVTPGAPRKSPRVEPPAGDGASAATPSARRALNLNTDEDDVLEEEEEVIDESQPKRKRG